LVSEQGNGVVLPPWVPTPGNRRFQRTMAEVEAAIYRVIEAGRRRTEPDGTLLWMLLNSRDERTGALLTDRDVRDEVFTMFVAGHETTALTLTWLLTLLEGRDEVLGAMRAEVDAVLGGRDPGFEDVPKLVYLRQVVDETLRLRGPVAMNARTAVADDEVLGFRVRKGDVVMPFFYAAQRHPDFWPEPEKFDPSRFTPEHSRGRNPWSYVPFSAGQRQCIGNTFSLVESVVLLAQLLQRFEVRLDPSVREVQPQALITVRPDRPVRVTLQARR
jgi:cytochrome P450